MFLKYIFIQSYQMLDILNVISKNLVGIVHTFHEFPNSSLDTFFGRHIFDEFHLAGTSQQALFGRHCFGTFHRKGRVWLKSASR